VQSTYEKNCNHDQGSILGVAIFPVDSERSESRDGYSSAIQIPTLKSSRIFNLFFHRSDTFEAHSALTRANNCVSDIRDGIAANIITLNGDKTKPILIGDCKRFYKILL